MRARIPSGQSGRELEGAPPGVARRQQGIGVDLIIAAHHQMVVFVLLGSGAAEESARVVGVRRSFGGQIPSVPIGFRFGNGARDLLAEFHRRHESGQGSLFVEPVTLERCEQKNLVLDDWAAERAAVLVVHPRRFARQQMVVGVQAAGLILLEQAAVQIVRAAFGDDVEVAGDGLPDFSRENVFRDFDFLHGFQTDALDEIEVLIERDRREFGIGGGVNAID